MEKRWRMNASKVLTEQHEKGVERKEHMSRAVINEKEPTKMHLVGSVQYSREGVP